MLPLILIPGHLCDARLYAPILAGLDGLFDARIAPPPERDDIAAMARAVLAEAPPRCALAGLSMGGMIAMEAMAQAPERLAGVALFSTDPTPARLREQAWRADLRARVGSEGLAPFVDAFLPRCFPPDGAAFARLGPQARAMMLDAPPARFAAQARALDGRRDMLDAIAGYAGPVEIVVGARDRVCPPLLHRPLAQALPDAHLAVVPEAGHLLTMETPEAAIAALTRLAARIAAQADA